MALMIVPSLPWRYVWCQQCDSLASSVCGSLVLCRLSFLRQEVGVNHQKPEGECNFYLNVNFHISKSFKFELNLKLDPAFVCFNSKSWQANVFHQILNVTMHLSFDLKCCFSFSKMWCMGATMMWWYDDQMMSWCHDVMMSWCDCMAAQFKMIVIIENHQLEGKGNFNLAQLCIGLLDVLVCRSTHFLIIST